MYKWIMSALIGLTCLLSVYLLLTTLPSKKDSQSEATPISIPDTAVDEVAAKDLYKVSCISCHGVDLEGKIGPNLTKIGASMSKEQIYKQIENGGGGMPLFRGRLSDSQITTLTNWLSDKK